MAGNRNLIVNGSYDCWVSPGSWTFLPGDPCTISFDYCAAITVESLDQTLKSITFDQPVIQIFRQVGDQFFRVG